MEGPAVLQALNQFTTTFVGKLTAGEHLGL